MPPEKIKRKSEAADSGTSGVNLDAVRAAKEKFMILESVMGRKDERFKTLTYADRVIFWAIANRISETRPTTWPGIDEIAALADAPPSQVYASLKKFGQLKIMHIEHRGGGLYRHKDGQLRGRPNFYSLVPLTLQDSETLQEPETTLQVSAGHTLQIGSEKEGQDTESKNEIALYPKPSYPKPYPKPFFEKGAARSANRKKEGLPENPILTVEWVQIARELGMGEESAEDRFALFVAFYRARGSKMADWSEAWRAWLLGAIERKPDLAEEVAYEPEEEEEITF